VKKITECRACGSRALSPAFAINGLGAYGRAAAGGRGGAGVEFVFCDPSLDAMACGLLQNAHAEREAPRRGAPSGTYRTVRSSLRSLATEALEMISGRDCAALDIGCSDGSLLSFYPRWVERHGVDIADDVDLIGQWAWTAKAAFPSAELDRSFAAKKFDIISAANVLEEIEAPRAFFARIKALLAPDGVLALETLYAPMTLTRNAAASFASGVAAVYSLGVLERIVRDSGLKIVRGALTDKDGGSIRLYVTHDTVAAYDFDPWLERLATIWDEENALAMRSRHPYLAFESRLSELRTRFATIVSDAAKRGETIHLCGPQSEARFLLAWMGGVASAVDALAAPGQPRGERLAGGQAIISEQESRLQEPDLLIASASLRREMLERWRDQIMKGMKLVFAAPTPIVIDSANFAAEFGKALGDAEGAGGAENLRSILAAAGGLRLVSDTARKSA